MTAGRNRNILWTLVGLTAGAALGVWLWARDREAAWRARLEHAEDTLGRELPRGAAQNVATVIGSDRRLSQRRVQVGTVAEGVVELTGTVQTREESDRAVELAQSTTGVYTVVNRLTIREEETKREETRRRWENGAPELTERHHYGMGVGMGTRRQSPDTDPDRPSDKQKRIERELDVPHVADELDDTG